MSEFVIEATNLTKTYGGNTVVNNLNMNVEKGRIYGLLGKNGAGKTTTMCMLLGLTAPTSGSIKIFGKPIKGNEKEIYSKMGAIIETPGFYPKLNAFDNLKILCKIHGDYDKERINEIIKLVKLDNASDKSFSQYSLGMKQRLGIAAAILHNPKILILDEPINGLDPVGIIEMRELFLDLKAKGVTIIISSHILSEIEAISDEIGIINDGVMVQEVTKEQLSDLTLKKVKFKVDNVDLAIKILKDNGFTDEDIEVSDYIIINNNIDMRAELNKQFILNDITVSEVILDEESLEQFFMKFLKGGNTDE